MKTRLIAAFIIIPVILAAQGLPIKSGTTSDLALVDTNKNVRTSAGASTRATYIASAGGLATTALYNLSIESAISTGFKIPKICIGISDATAAAAVTVTVQRRTTASSGGTAATAEGTTTPAVSKMDPADANFGGVVRVTGTLGTAGAVLDQWGLQVGELGAGTADPPGPPVFCKEYGGLGEKMPVASAGVANGISINVTAPGAGGLASGSISATIIAE